MAIKMVHAEHGATHAYNPHEVEALQKAGWTIAPPKLQEKSEPARRKPGPKPKAK